MSALILSLLLAHGLGPTPVAVTVRPGNDNDVVVSTNFGGVVSHDKGATWRLICDEGIGYGKVQRPAWWLSPGSAMFAGTYKGLYVARTGGCTWDPIPDFDQTGCFDLRGQSGTLVAVSAKFGATNRISRSVDDGLTWTPTPESSATLFYTSVRFAPSNSQRVYAAAWWFDPALSSWLFRSDDNGQTFARIDLSATLPAAGPFYVLAVHPTKPAVVFASVARETDPVTGWLLRSTDSGDTFSVVATTPVVFNSVSFGADPNVVYAASSSALLRSTDEGLTFTPVVPPRADACVTTQGDAVYACGWQEMDGWSVGTGTDAGFTGLLTWRSIQGPLACPAGTSINTLCEPLWPQIQSTFPPEPDAGRPDSGTPPDGGEPPDGGDETDGGVGPPPPPPKVCGCTSATGPLGLAALALLTRRRSRRKR